MPISLSGSLNLSGSLTTTGTITATTLVVQTITSSISSITGSTNFGTLSSDTHTFTGSLNVTGSLSVVTTGTEFQVTNTGVKFGNVSTDTHIVTGSLLISGSNVLIGTPTSNGFRFKVSNNGAEEWALNPGDSPNVNNHVNYNRNTSAYIGANYSAATHSFLQGNVGIGTSNPELKLQIECASGDGIYLRSSQTTTGAADTGAVFAFAANDGTSTRDAVYIKGLKENSTVGNYASYLSFFTRPNGSSPTERMRITSGGFFKASNFADPTYGLYYHQIFNNIYGDWIIELAQYNTVPYGLLIRYPNAAPRGGGNEMLYLNDSTGNVFKVSSNGNVYNLNNSYNALSDIKLKENITDATPKLDKLMQVRVVNFNLKTDPNIKQIGVIAQELQEVFPGLVEENYDRDSDNKLNGETTLGVKYSVFVPMLIKAIQELTARVQYLENK